MTAVATTSPAPATPAVPRADGGTAAFRSRPAEVREQHQVVMRVGIPLPGGQLVAGARERGYPVLFSANAFARTYPKGHEREGFFRRFATPDPAQLAGLDAALDSAGFVAAAKYGDYRWTVEEYFELVAAHPWTFYAALDYCCEAAVAGDRPLRLLRMAATAHLLGRCRREATERGLPPPMPVLQGWLPDEYALSARWLPLTEWPSLVGVGSVCRRHLHGSDGLLAILEALDQALPPHVRLHLFGVKGSALQVLCKHPRVASVDSMAWDFQARVERRTGRDMRFRLVHMARWVDRQNRAVAGAPIGAGLQQMLFAPEDFGGAINSFEHDMLELLAMHYAELIMSGDIEYPDAVHRCRIDGVVAAAICRHRSHDQEAYADLEAIAPGLGAFARAEHAAQGGAPLESASR